MFLVMHGIAKALTETLDFFGGFGYGRIAIVCPSRTVTYPSVFRAQKTSASFLAMSSPVGLVSCMDHGQTSIPSCTFTVHSSYGSVTYYRTSKSFRGPWTKIETTFK